MTPMMMTKEAFAGLGAPNLVYVREVTGADVLEDIADVDQASVDIDPDAVLYAVHSANGDRLAVMADRATAFAAAVAHELAPVSVH